MAQIEEDDLKNYNLKRFDCEDPFFMEIFALKVDDAGYMVFPGHTLVCKERVCLGGLFLGAKPSLEITYFTHTHTRAKKSPYLYS